MERIGDTSMRMPKIILEQIDKSNNPNRNLGSVKLDKPIQLSYRDSEDVSSEELATLIWKKRYYSFDRGDFFQLDIYKFVNYFGKIYRTSVNSSYGNFTDYLPESYSNVHYSTQVYVKQNTNISLDIDMSYGSLSIYLNQVAVFVSSDSNYYIPGKHSIYFKKGWNTIDFFVYHKTGSGRIIVKSDLGKRVETSRAVDFEPPSPPKWYTKSPLVTEYVDVYKSNALQNVLRWKNNTYALPYSSIRGWGAYRRLSEQALNTDGTPILVVSGWSDSGFITSGDKRVYFPSDMFVQPGFSAFFRVSGTDYHASDDQTLVTVSGSGLNFTLSAGRIINRRIYKHLFDIEYDPTLPVIVSGIDNKDLKQGMLCEYALDCYDDSVNKNRSNKTDVQTIITGDFTKPVRLDSSNITIAGGGLKRVIATIKNPDRWSPPAPEIRGFRVWTSANPVVPYDNYYVGEWPLNISGTNTRMEITSTVNAGQHIPLTDKTAYSFYISTYDWYGNQELTSLPSITATTSVIIKTDQTSSRVEISSETGALHIYADLA